MKNFKNIETINFPTTYGDFDLDTYRIDYSAQPLMRYILVIRSKTLKTTPIIRLHSACLLGETFASTHCDCGEQLEASLKIIGEKGGMIFYLDQEGRGHGLLKKIEELKLQEEFGMDTVEASEHLHLEPDERKFDIVGDILKFQGIKNVKILTNNPRKIKELENEGIEVIEGIPLEIKPHRENLKYLRSKKQKLDHMLKKYV